MSNSIGEPWAQREMKGMDCTNTLLTPMIIKVEAKEITFKAQNFVISNFNCESGTDVNKAFVKQCTDVPELSVDLKVAAIRNIREMIREK